MNQMNYVTLVIEITVCKFVPKTITKMDFRYQTDVNKKAKKVPSLVLKIYFIY